MYRAWSSSATSLRPLHPHRPPPKLIISLPHQLLSLPSSHPTIPIQQATPPMINLFIHHNTTHLLKKSTRHIPPTPTLPTRPPPA